MKLILAQNEADLGKKAAAIFLDTIQKKSHATLGLATGSSPISTYAALINAYQKGLVSFSRVHTLNLDEYVGLAPENDQSYHYFMKQNLFDSIDIDPANTHLPTADAADLDAACKEYNDLIDRFPIDLQLLGIGGNGHLGFNEPGTPFDIRTHLVDLTEKTRKDNSRLFPSLNCVPKQAITMGIGDILKAKAILLIAFGENKASAIENMLKGPISPACPASVLRTHPNVTLVADAAALKNLDKKDLEILS
ncbi:MAG: glucosamine-6-phosphate deaminase [Clostridia bacterium]|nr:glucosamine-6-phosphate deaminase [Clostridia bacterium]